ncbi:bromodomain-containing protein 8 isoform X1 [Petromyzon marinus]|uniref:bromodomain-containing protein 8 isoform X1 n=1 Tax=Petromyzon marinus TaxID=7757 RepID=UPI003F6EC1B6
MAGPGPSKHKLQNVGPQEEWSIREKLCLASSVMRSGDQNWVSVSRAIKPFAEPGRPPDWFSQKHCASQYSELLETTETPKRKRGERGEVVETIEDVIVKKLTVERIEELTKSIRDIQDRYKKLKHELELVQNGQLDHNLHEIWNDIVARKKQDEEEAEAKRKAVEEAYQARMAIKNASKRPLASIRTLSADPTTSGLDSPSPDVASGSDVVMAQPPLGGITVMTPAVSSPVTSTPTAAPGVDDSLAKKAANIGVQKPSPPQSPLTELLRKNGIPSFGTVTSEKCGEGTFGETGIEADTVPLHEMPITPSPIHTIIPGPPSAVAPTLSKLLESGLSAVPIPATIAVFQTPPMEAPAVALRIPEIPEPSPVLKQAQEEAGKVLANESDVQMSVTVVGQRLLLPCESNAHVTVVTAPPAVEAPAAEMAPQEVNAAALTTDATAAASVPAVTVAEEIPQPKSELTPPALPKAEQVVPEAARVEVQPLAEVLTEQPQVEEVVVESLQQALMPQVEEEAAMEVVEMGDGDGDGDVLGEMEDGEQDIDIPLGSEEEKALLEEQSPPSHPEIQIAQEEEGMAKEIFSTPPETPAPMPAPMTTPMPTLISTPISTPIPTSTPLPIPTPMPTPIPTHVATPIVTPVATPMPTPMATPMPTPMATPMPTPVATPIPTLMSTPTPTPMPTLIPTPMPTPMPTPARDTSPTPLPTPSQEELKPSLVQPFMPPPEVKEEIAVEAAKLSPHVEPVPQVTCEAADPPAEQLASPKVQAHTSPQPTSPVTQPKDETEIQAADPATEGVVEDVEQRKNEQLNLEATAQTEPLVDVENKCEDTTEASEEVETHQIPDIVPEEEEDDEVTVKKDEPDPEETKQEQAVPSDPASPASSTSSKVPSEDTPLGIRRKPGRPNKRSMVKKIVKLQQKEVGSEAGSIEEERSETDILEVMEHGASESEDGSSMHNTLHMPSTSLTDSVPNSPASSQFSIGSEDPEALQAQKIWKKSIMLVWRAAANHKYANVFLQPVTNDIAPGYHSIVHRPMDLSTIKKNIENGAIRTTAEFQRDVMLMFQNAIMYNSSDHDVFHMAVEMQRDVMEHVQQFLATQLIMQTSESSVGAKVLRGRDPAKKQESLEKVHAQTLSHRFAVSRASAFSMSSSRGGSLTQPHDTLSMCSPAFLLSLFDVGTRGRRSAIEADMKMKK